MKKIRRGNDFVFAWEIERNGLPENLSSVLEKHLYLYALGKRVELLEGIDYDITGNVIRIEVTPAVASILGTYKAEFHYILPDNGLIDEDRKCAVDVEAFVIVSSTAQADDPSEFTVTSDMAIAFKGDKGDSSYQTWLDAGNTGTEADYLAWIQKPATDIEQIVSVNETARVSAEGTRQNNETSRVEAETLRGSAETQRISDENTRKSNETGRINAESLRLSAEEERGAAEGLRVSSETSRNTAEGHRATAETARATAEGIRNENETARINAESDRVDAEDLRDQAEAAREEAEGLRQTNTNTAIQAAGEATTAAKTAAGLADTARLAIQSDLASKANQTELDQLAGEVSLFKDETNLNNAVQSDKIKDIENVISTMNPNQSAQLSVSGRKTALLPKNAANGGMEVKLEGLTAENLVVNGDFRNGPTGWPAIGTPSVMTITDKLAVNGTVANSSAGYYKDISTSTGDKIYIAITSTNGATNFPRIILFDFGTIANTKVTDINGVINSVIETSKINGVRFYIQQLLGAAYTNVTIDNIRIINLTETFGAGNEPTKEQCDIIFSDYFEGVKSFEPTGRVRSVDKNGLNPTELYLTAPELRSNGTVKDEIRKGANGYELVKRVSGVDGTVLATPVISPINYGGILNSAENGTVYHEPVIADAGVYGTNMPILLTDYPISALEEIIKHENGVDTYLDVSTAVIAGDKLSFTHPSLQSGDLVLFTYAFSKETTNGNITATFYDSNVVKIDTVTGKAYKINEVVTNGVLTRTLTEV